MLNEHFPVKKGGGGKEMLNFESGKIMYNYNVHKGRPHCLPHSHLTCKGKKTLIIPGNNVRVKVDLAFCIMKGEC